jgi:hypothetical protein
VLNQLHGYLAVFHATAKQTPRALETALMYVAANAEELDQAKAIPDE